MSAVYIAASTSNHAEAGYHAKTLEEHGIRVTSTWHKRALDWSVEKKQSHARECALRCLLEIDLCDALIYLPSDQARGALVEAGYAMGRDKQVFAVGRWKDATIMLSGAVWLPSVRAVCEVLAAVRK